MSQNLPPYPTCDNPLPVFPASHFHLPRGWGYFQWTSSRSSRTCRPSVPTVPLRSMRPRMAGKTHWIRLLRPCAGPFRARLAFPLDVPRGLWSRFPFFASGPSSRRRRMKTFPAGMAWCIRPETDGLRTTVSRAWALCPGGMLRSDGPLGIPYLLWAITRTKGTAAIQLTSLQLKTTRSPPPLGQDTPSTSHRCTKTGGAPAWT